MNVKVFLADKTLIEKKHLKKTWLSFMTVIFFLLFIKMI